MTPPSFHRLVDDYLRVRRGLGFDLESTEWKLRDFATYADRIGRNGCRAAPRSEYFFRTERSPRLQRHAVEKTFAGIRQRLGWAGHGRTRQPRIHDLRHTFVTRRPLRWCQDGTDVDRKILALATYLGHAKVTDTYWYCTAVPELLGSTSQRFERFTHPTLERPS